MLQNNQPRRNFRSFRAAVTVFKWPGRAKAGGVSRDLIYRAIVERHIGNHTGLPHSAKACPRGQPAGKGGPGIPKQRALTRRAGRADTGEGPMGVALDKSAQNRASRPAPEVAPAPTAGSKAMSLKIESLKFEIVPTA